VEYYRNSCGVATKANMIDGNRNVPRAKNALLADAVGTCLGTSTLTAMLKVH
jgi:adenine/guanine/hypoxanthine permease